MILGIDIGGTTIKGGVVTKSGKVIKRASIPSITKRGHNHFIASIERCIDILFTREVHAIGVGCPGPLDPRRGIILHSPNIPLKRFPLRDYLRSRYHRSVTIDNDANAFVLAEAIYGAGKQYRMVVGLTLGTGIGGGIVIEKKIEHGRGNAGELGFLSLSIDGPRGRLGDSGSLQEYLRGEPLERLKRKLGLSASTTKEIERLARKNNRAARAYWNMFGTYSGIGIASLIHVLDPDVIILGGKMSRAFPLFRETLLATVRARTIIPPPPIRRAGLGDDAGIIGAALLTQNS